MKKTLLLISILCMIFATVLNAQSHQTGNPLEFFFGEWVQKTSSIDPAPKNDAWKAQVTNNTFIPILDGKGAHRIATSGNTTLEGYFFYDTGAGKVYGMSVDDNGYVWQTESILDDNGNIVGNSGRALNDDSVGIETDFEFIDENEFRFIQYFFEEGQQTIAVEGVFIRVR